MPEIETSDGVRLWASDDGSGPPVVLVAGYTDGVRGIVSIDQTPKMINAEDWAYGFYGLAPDVSGTFFAGGVPATGRRRTVDLGSPALQRLIQRVGPEGLPGRLRPETLPLLHDHAQQDWRDVIARVGVPVLMVAGRESQYWPCEHAEAAVRDVAQGRAVVVEDSGHAVNFDQPDEFGRVLLDFLGEL